MTEENTVLHVDNQWSHLLHMEIGDYVGRHSWCNQKEIASLVFSSLGLTVCYGCSILGLGSTCIFRMQLMI